MPREIMVDCHPRPKKKIDIDTGHVSLSYNRLKKKPTINGIELVGNVTSQDLGLFPDWKAVDITSPNFIRNKPFQTIDGDTLFVNENGVLGLNPSIAEDLHVVRTKILELDERVSHFEEGLDHLEDVIYDSLAFRDY